MKYLLIIIILASCSIILISNSDNTDIRQGRHESPDKVEIPINIANKNDSIQLDSIKGGG